MITNLKVGDQVAYVRLCVSYAAGRVTRIQDGTIETDRGLTFIFNLNYSRYVLRGDPSTFLTRHIDKGEIGQNYRVPRTSRQLKAS